jgi:hypothetical protein
MNRLPTISIASRLNALAAAAIVTLTLLAGIDSLAALESAAPQLAQAAADQAV